MSHDDFAFEPVRGLPAELPVGEKLLWQGSPLWQSLAVRAYHVRKIALYFMLLVAWRIGLGVYNGHAALDIETSCLLLVTSGSVAVGVLSLLAYCNARSTVYSITSRRVVLRHGVAVPLTMNIPFRLIDTAALKTYADQTGDIALGLHPKQRIGYFITWPHLRPGKITRPQPSFRALQDGPKAAAILGEALSAAASIPASSTVRARVPEPQATAARTAATA